MLKNNNTKIVSLQGQYIISALMLGIIIIAATLFAYSKIINTSSALAKQAKDVSELLNKTSEIQYLLTHTSKAINIFMLKPEQSEQKDIVKRELKESHLIINSLNKTKIITDLQLKSTLTNLSKKLNQLDQASQLLFKIRVSANEQYPALKISTERMRPIRNNIYTVFNTTLDELQSEYSLTVSPEFSLFLRARYIWLRTISEYRLYLTNRIGSFNKKQLLEQEKNIEEHIVLLNKIISSLNSEASGDYFGFEGKDLIATLPSLIKNWKTAYLEVKEINHSGKWRQDTELMRATIIPLSEDIQRGIKKIKNTLREKNQHIITSLKTSASKQSYILISVVIFFLLYIFISIILLKQLLIKPIKLIATTLKEAANDPSLLNKLTFNQTKETKDLIEAFHVMSKQITARQNELEHRALHDGLTSLPNRVLLLQRLEYQTLISDRENKHFSLMMLDLNRFKEINDTLGHHIGDEVLIQVSNRLDNLMRKIDTIARLGGDEFAILLPNTEKDDAIIVADKIGQALKDDVLISNYALQISSSIGITFYPTDGNDASMLIQHADIAMYNSKKNKSKFEFYDPDKDTHSLAQLSLGKDLELALKNDELEMYFQPKFNLNTGNIDGAEALLRWKHKEFGYVYPEKIIEIAETVGLIDEITYWVINRSVQGCSSPLIDSPFNLSVNLEVQSLRDINLLEETVKILSENPNFNHQLTFEITESAMMKNPEQSINILNELKAIGIKISIDDFGTGFSSLAYLKQLPVSQLKIDKSFVMDMLQDESDRAIVYSTIKLSHSLGLEVVAEGIENKEALEMLKDMKCDVGQGYYFSIPLPPHEFQQYIKYALANINS